MNGGSKENVQWVMFLSMLALLVVLNFVGTVVVESLTKIVLYRREF